MPSLIKASSVRSVEEDGVGNVVVPHQRRPEEEHARRSCGRAADLALSYPS